MALLPQIKLYRYTPELIGCLSCIYPVLPFPLNLWSSSSLFQNSHFTEFRTLSPWVLPPLGHTPAYFGVQVLCSDPLSLQARVEVEQISIQTLTLPLSSWELGQVINLLGAALSLVKGANSHSYLVELVWEANTKLFTNTDLLSLLYSAASLPLHSKKKEMASWPRHVTASSTTAPSGKGQCLNHGLKHQALG